MRAAATAVALLLWTTLAFAADWTRVQGVSKQTGSGGTSNNQAFGAAVTSGDIVVGGLLINAGSATDINVVSVTDDKGNPYRVVLNDGGVQTANNSVACFRSLHPITNGPTTITATVTNTTTVFWMAQDEFTPPTGTSDISLSGNQHMVSDSGTALPNFQTLDGDVLVWGLMESSGTVTAGAGFTAGIGSGTALMSEWKIEANPTNTESVTWTAGTAGSAWACALAIAPHAQTRWEVVQRAINRSGTGTSASLVFPNAIGAGNMIAGALASDIGGISSHLTSIQDNQGNNYSLVTGTFNTGQGAPDRQSFWSNGLIANGPTTITATYNLSQAVNFLQGEEIAPPPGTVGVAIDGTPVNINDGSNVETSITTPNVTATKAGDFAHAWCDIGPAGTAPGNSFAASNGQSMTWMSAYYITGAPGAYNFVCNHTAGTGGNDASLALFSFTQPAAAAIGAGSVSLRATLGLRGAGGIGAR